MIVIPVTDAPIKAHVITAPIPAVEVTEIVGADVYPEPVLVRDIPVIPPENTDETVATAPLPSPPVNTRASQTM